MRLRETSQFCQKLCFIQKHLAHGLLIAPEKFQKTKQNKNILILEKWFYLIWFRAQRVSMNSLGSTSVAGERYAAVSLMSSPTLSISLLMSSDLGEADGCLHPSGAEAHGACLAHTWQSLCRFGEVMGHHASVLTFTSHPSHRGAEHGRINDLLGEKKHKEAAQTAHCAGIVAQNGAHAGQFWSRLTVRTSSDLNYA